MFIRHILFQRLPQRLLQPLLDRLPPNLRQPLLQRLSPCLPQRLLQRLPPRLLQRQRLHQIVLSTGVSTKSWTARSQKRSQSTIPSTTPFDNAGIWKRSQDAAQRDTLFNASKHPCKGSCLTEFVTSNLLKVKWLIVNLLILQILPNIGDMFSTWTYL